MGSIRIQLGYTWPNVTISVIMLYGFIRRSYERLFYMRGTATLVLYKYLSNSDEVYENIIYINVMWLVFNLLCILHLHAKDIQIHKKQMLSMSSTCQSVSISKMFSIIRYTFWPHLPSNNEILRDNIISIKVWCTSISITIISLIQLNIRVDLSSMNERITDGIASTKILLSSTYQNARMIRINESVVGCWICCRNCVRDIQFFLYDFH